MNQSTPASDLAWLINATRPHGPAEAVSAITIDLDERFSKPNALIPAVFQGQQFYMNFYFCDTAGSMCYLSNVAAQGRDQTQEKEWFLVLANIVGAFRKDVEDKGIMQLVRQKLEKIDYGTILQEGAIYKDIAEGWLTQASAMIPIFTSTEPRESETPAKGKDRVDLHTLLKKEDTTAAMPQWAIDAAQAVNQMFFKHACEGRGLAEETKAELAGMIYTCFQQRK